ncbi:hypothetical protein EON81_21080 [bacterium]|nr:MAG: hypothetical protein EON81_21080 [bacterium]
MKRIISLGAGWQSSAMLLWGLEGRFGDLPDAAVFADTGNEPAHVYAWLDRLEAFVAPFPIVRVSAGNLGKDYIGGRRRAAIPAFTTTQEGKPTMMSRFCSKTYKVEVIQRAVRKLVGRRGTAESWIGISLDEAHRGYKPTGKKWISNRYPLLDERIKREECGHYVVKRLGVLPPKSACVFCPFHGDDLWIDLKANHPEDFERAVEFDRSIRNLTNDKWDRPRFLHRSLKPLDQVAFMHEHQPDLWGNECEGMCGV